jgi:uncharacterized membrane protein YphA (DoxX/SURF4 family)
MLRAMQALVLAARRRRWVNLVVINVRFLIGFAFLPAALKKITGEPFTDPANHGRFHDFLHAFHATGAFYQFVGVMQLIAAALLFTQRFATLGALVALPILTAITALCWSTGVYPTAAIATLLWLGTVGLVLWDLPKLRGLFVADDLPVRRWTICGIAMLALYLGSTLLRGGVYRPRGMEWSEPAFYVMPIVMLLPIVTLVLDRRR